MSADIQQNVIAQVIAGLILLVIGFVATGMRAHFRTRLARWCEYRRALRSGALQREQRAFNEQLFGGLGESEYVHLLYAPPTVGAIPVEIETPDGRQVWGVTVPPGRHASDVALASRWHFKLTDQF